MSARLILVDEIAPGRAAAALIEGGRLEDLMIDPAPGDTTPVPGEIHRARVDRLVPKLGAAFVRLGAGGMGFLREARSVREGETLLVQVTGYPEPGKASPVTARVLYKGRHVIHTPDAPGINVSRQIRDPDERARLAETAGRLFGRAAGASGGLILRTAAEGVPEAALAEDLAAVLARRTAAEGEGAGKAAGDVPTVAARERPVETALREWQGAPAPEGSRFEHLGLAEEIERLRSPRVELASGAWMRVEPTAALVAVDVNTGGGFQGGDALAANLAAARELPRQLRLRGLGGIVTLDPAPLPKRDRKRIEDAVKTALRRDPVETTVAGWTPLGLLELQRKRERRPLSELL